MNETVLARDVRRIAVLRALQLGDMLCAVPALRSLRAAAPDAQITLIGLSWADEFARIYAGLIDRFIALPGYPRLPETQFEARAFRRFLACAHASRFDLAVQLHGSGEITNTLIALLGARRAAGFARRGAWRPDGGAFIPHPDGHEIHRLLALTESLGAQSRGDALEFPTQDSEAAVGSVDPTLLDRPYVCIHAGARSGARWAPEAFATVADALAARGLRVVLTGAADEATLAERVRAEMRHPATILAGRTDLAALGTVIARSRLLVCNDTGVAHLGAAVGSRSVIVSSNPEIARWAPLDTSLHRTVHGRGVAPACDPAAHPAGHVCVETVTPADVLREADGVLSAERVALAVAT